MWKCRRYDQEYKDMIVELFKSGMNLAELNIQKLMAKLGLCATTIKKYKPHSNKKTAEDLENLL